MRSKYPQTEPVAAPFERRETIIAKRTLGKRPDEKVQVFQARVAGVADAMKTDAQRDRADAAINTIVRWNPSYRRATIVVTLYSNTKEG